MHPTTQLCNFYIGPDDQPKKIKIKFEGVLKAFLLFIYAPYNTIISQTFLLQLFCQPSENRKRRK